VDGPKTGDTGNIWLWATLLVAAALGLRMLLLSQKTNEGAKRTISRLRNSKKGESGV
jgi:hypothetical protein